MIQSVRVIGLGKVGELVATLLADSGFDVTRLRRAGANRPALSGRRPRRPRSGCDYERR